MLIKCELIDVYTSMLNAVTFFSADGRQYNEALNWFAINKNCSNTVCKKFILECFIQQNCFHDGYNFSKQEKFRLNKLANTLTVLNNQHYFLYFVFNIAFWFNRFCKHDYKIWSKNKLIYGKMHLISTKENTFVLFSWCFVTL